MDDGRYHVKRRIDGLDSFRDAVFDASGRGNGAVDEMVSGLSNCIKEEGQ